MKDNKIILVEPLHYVLQGEGKNLGKKMILLRVAGCNVQCPDCDTTYSWKFSKKDFLLSYTKEELLKEIYKINNKKNINHLLVTGGEPAIWQEFLSSLLLSLNTFFFDVETSGYDEWKFIKNHPELSKKVHFNISPKIGALKAKKTSDLKDIYILRDPPLNYIVKIVSSRKTFFEDLQQIEKLIEYYGIPRNKIFLMPFAKTREELLEESEFLIDQCFIYGFEFSPRLHILIFNNQRLK
jgi:organic radical activating enzyme